MSLAALLACAACRKPAQAPAPRAAPAACAPLGEDTLDLAEAALLDGGADTLSLDDAGCRTYRVAWRDGGAARLELRQRGTLTYAREVAPGEVLDLIDADGDGVFERELFEKRDDAGRVAWSTTERRDAGVLRVREERVRLGLNRTVRERWVDGGWFVDSDSLGPSKPRLGP